MADQIQKILSLVFLNKIKMYNSTIITITKVKMTSDLRLAKIYLSIFNSDSENTEVEFKNILKERNKIRYDLGLNLQSKYVPKIKFFLEENDVLDPNLFNIK
tara:strand:+ start:528 stop:833 length:306 start_codon:yes stop_codon:yes gene_type:complete